MQRPEPEQSLMCLISGVASPDMHRDVRIDSIYWTTTVLKAEKKRYARMQGQELHAAADAWMAKVNASTKLKKIHTPSDRQLSQCCSLEKWEECVLSWHSRKWAAKGTNFKRIMEDALRTHGRF